MKYNNTIKTAGIAHGEWWIVDGQAIFADGDSGDLNHVAYAEQHARYLLTDDSDDNSMSMQGYLTEQAIQIRDKLVSTSGNQDADFLEELAGTLNHLIASDTESFVLSYIDEMNNLGLTPIDFDLLMMATGHHRDPRRYAMQKWGWKRVANNYIETWTLTSGDLKSISRGLDDIYPEAFEGEDLKFDIEVASNNKTYRDVPLDVINAGNVSAILEFSKKYSYSKTKQENRMKIILSKKQWEQIGKKAGWTDYLPDNPGSEAEADLSTHHETGGEPVSSDIEGMKRKYASNKSASVGTLLACPMCEKGFGKKSQQQAFCCNKCKDKYWNTVVPERAQRARLHNPL